MDFSKAKRGFSSPLIFSLLFLIAIAFGLFALVSSSKSLIFNTRADQSSESWLGNVFYPRLQSRHQFGIGGGFDTDPLRYSKYDFVGFVDVPLDEDDNVIVDFTSLMKGYNPNVRTRIYMNPDLLPKDIDQWPGHYLFFAGATLKNKVTASQTTFTLNSGAGSRFKVGAFAMLWDFKDKTDVEHVKIVQITGDKLTVKRNSVPEEKDHVSSIARPHAAGVRIAMHVYNSTPERWVGNMSRQCVKGTEGKACGQDFKNFADVVASFQANRISKAKVDGLKIDNAFTFPYGIEPFDQKMVDYNNDNAPDGTTSPWASGMLYLYQALREKAGPIPLFIGNNAVVNQYLNGKFYQGWNLDQDHGGKLTSTRWDATMSDYSKASVTSFQPVLIVTDPEVAPNNFQVVRFTLAATLLGDGLFGNDGADKANDNRHTSDTWYDEYDNGAGTSLVSNVNSSQTVFPVFPGTASRFVAGDVIYMPDETLKVTSVNLSTDELTVQRAFVPENLQSIRETLKVSQDPLGSSVHLKGEKIYTIAQVKAGKGFLGKSLSKPTFVCKVASFKSQNCLRYFEKGVVLVNPTNFSQSYSLKANTTFQRIDGTQDRTVNNGALVNGNVILKAHDGLILLNAAPKSINQDLGLNLSTNNNSLIASWQPLVGPQQTNFDHFSVVVRKVTPDQLVSDKDQRDVGSELSKEFDVSTYASDQYYVNLRAIMKNGQTVIQAPIRTFTIDANHNLTIP